MAHPPPPANFHHAYVNHPSAQVLIGPVGSTGTAPMNDSNPASERRVPRYVIAYRDLCDVIIQRTAQSIPNRPISPELRALHNITSSLIAGTEAGDETRNIDLFTYITAYVRMFVVELEQLILTDIRAVPCEGQTGVRPNRKLQRGGVDRIIIEHKGKGAFDRHAEEIQSQASAWEGTELICSSHETGARSIVLKLGRHMVSASCEWGILYGGDRYILFYLKRVQNAGEIYHQLLVSPCQYAFSGTVQLIPLVIALLRDDSPTLPPSSTPTARIVTRYVPQTRRSGR